MVDYKQGNEQLQGPLDAMPFHEWIFPGGTVWTRFYRKDNGYLLRFPELADFEVSNDGVRVTSYPAPGISENTVLHLYLNQVLPLALSKQGKLVFHGSAVEIDGFAVAFLGESGKGKSTLAASFASNGFGFLTDDGLMVESHSAGYQVVPSHPSIRLWEDSEEAIVAPETPTAPALEFTSKSRFLAGEKILFCDSSRPLKRVYFLGDGEASEIKFERLAAAEALIALVKHSFLLDIEERELLAVHFDELSRLANLPIYYQLDYPRRFDDLPRVRQAIIEHASKGEDA